MRSAMIFISKFLGDSPLVGVEIGVASGTHSREILEGLNIKKLYLIDIWKSYLMDGVEVACYVNYYKKVLKEFNHYKNVEILKEHSIDATSHVPNNLDFVYIDGNHDYEAAKEDILCWYPKVRIGGVLAGHDYLDKYSGVIQAVDEFTDMHNYDKNVNSDFVINSCDWWLVKGDEI